MSSEAVIELRHLSKMFPLYQRPAHRVVELVTLGRVRRHQEFWALQDVDLEVKAGTTVGVVGQNGSGKSTLLQIVAGIMRQTRGDCRVRGKVSALLELASGFNPEFTGRENVFMNGAILGYTRAEMEARLEAILEFAGIGEFVDRPVKTYSSGMFMRLAFSVAIHVDPDILLVDEALAVGDLIFQHRCTNWIQQLRRQGKTVLFVTHDLEAVTRFCDRAILLDGGRKLEDGDPARVVERYRALIFERERRSAAVGAVAPELVQEETLPLVDTIPHIHNRYGEGGAKVVGIIVVDEEGQVLNQVKAGQQVHLMISARFERDFRRPIVGFTIRDRLGVEMAASNTSYEGLELPPARAGQSLTARFTLQVPDLRPGSYSISPAVADGSVWEHTIQDWIDNAYILTLVETGLVYGMMRWPVEAAYRAFGPGE